MGTQQLDAGSQIVGKWGGGGGGGGSREAGGAAGAAEDGPPRRGLIRERPLGPELDFLRADAEVFRPVLFSCSVGLALFVAVVVESQE